MKDSIKKALITILVPSLMVLCSCGTSGISSSSSNSDEPSSSIRGTSSEESSSSIESSSEESSSSSSSSSSDSTSDSSSSNNGDREYQEPTIGGTYLDRIESMVTTGMEPSEEDMSLPDVADYDETAVLGSAAHPLLNQPDSEYIEVVAVEQPEEYGDALLVKCGDAEIAIDFGNYASTNYDDGTNYGSNLSSIYDFYIEDGKCELVITSHPHSDHIGGLNGFLSSSVSSVGMYVDYGYRYGNTDNALVSSLRTGKTYGQVYHSAYDLVNSLNGGLPRTYITQEMFIDWIDTGFYQSNPSLSYRNLTYKGTSISDLNVTSVTGILNYKEFSFFFDGDMQDSSTYSDLDGETEMVTNAGSSLHDVTMSKIAHHGSTNGTNVPLLSATEPKVGLISAGRVNPSDSYEMGGETLYGACSGHPHRAMMGRLFASGRRADTKAYLNSASGTLHFVTNGIDDVYVQGSPLKSNLIGGTSVKGATALNLEHGYLGDWDHDLLNTEFYGVCHRK